MEFGVERMGCYTGTAFERLVACEPVGSGSHCWQFSHYLNDLPRQQAARQTFVFLGRFLAAWVRWPRMRLRAIRQGQIAQW